VEEPDARTCEMRDGVTRLVLSRPARHNILTRRRLEALEESLAPIESTPAIRVDGVVNVVTGYGDLVGQAITEHMDIDMVSFTGSTRVGRSALVASARNIKKLGLELGGKSPQLVFADADLDAAAVRRLL